jgi:hypothetical protein
VTDRELATTYGYSEREIDSICSLSSKTGISMRHLLSSGALMKPERLRNIDMMRGELRLTRAQRRRLEKRARA